MLKNIHFILSHTSHPGNIGGAARAMKNMALSELCLVSPLQFPNANATERASGADDLLTHAKVVSSLEEGLNGVQWVFGTSARSREFQWPQLTPKLAAAKIMTAAQSDQTVAVLFGNEQSGLSNEELQLCDFHIAIPTNPAFSSLNLASAVQVIAYEIYQASLTDVAMPDLEEKASVDDIQGLLKHLIDTSIDIGFLDPNNPKKLIPRLKKLFTKARLTPEEVNILRGFLKAVRVKAVV